MPVKPSVHLFPDKKHYPVGWVERSETQRIISMFTTKIYMVEIKVI
jgi:hypothetical protein